MSGPRPEGQESSGDLGPSLQRGQSLPSSSGTGGGCAAQQAVAPTLRRTVSDTPHRPSAREAGCRVDRRPFRAMLVRQRSRDFGIIASPGSPGVAVARTGARGRIVQPTTTERVAPQDTQSALRVLLGHAFVSTAVSIQARVQRLVLEPFPKKLAHWRAMQPPKEVVETTSGQRARLAELEARVQQLRKDLEACAAELQEERPRTSTPGEEGADSGDADPVRPLQDGLAEVVTSLEAFGKQSLSWAPRQDHSRLQAECTELNKRLAALVRKREERESTCTDAAADSKDAEEEAAGCAEAEKVEKGEEEEDDMVKKALSVEQQRAFECPEALFLQGRSGTGKTLVLVRRILRRQALLRTRATGGDSDLPQLYVTKSSLLRDQVVAELAVVGCHCGASQWPPQGVICATWDQLVELMGGVKATVGYARFLSSYWPRLRQCARELSPLVIWAEFCTRLRPFLSVGVEQLSLGEYLKDDLAAVGIRLDQGDLHAIYYMFKEYTHMKLAIKEYDDVDVAMRLRERLRHGSVGGRYHLASLYIDEAQDFAPAELMVLLELCGEPDGVTVAGDTCQTINPGSAFSFRDIKDAFVGLHASRKGASSGGKDASPAQIAKRAEILTLSRNYRCAPGVAALAGSVTGLLLHRFPRCADRVEEETLARADVEIPVFLQWPGQLPATVIMGSGSKRLRAFEAARIATLVRSDAERQVLLDQRVHGTILTVSEAKGLEFDFVVVCGLLSSLQDGIVSALADETSMESELVSEYGSGACARLAGPAHGLLCKAILAIPELKLLYVALTRARCGCVVVECGPRPHHWETLLLAWQTAGLVEVWSGADGFVAGTDPSAAAAAAAAAATQSAAAAAAAGTGAAASASSAQSSAAAAAVATSDVSSGAHISAQDMIAWIRSELHSRSATRSKMTKTKHKDRERKEVQQLRDELQRLQRGGEVDPDFGQAQEEGLHDADTAKAWMKANGMGTSTREGMISWIHTQLQALSSKRERGPRKKLKEELERLTPTNAKIDEGFCDKFAYELQACRLLRETQTIRPATQVADDRPLLRVPRPAPVTNEEGDIPSFVPVLQRRFGLSTTGSMPVKDLHEDARRLLRHAQENPRERWQVYATARNSLFQALQVVDTVLAEQVARIGAVMADQQAAEAQRKAEEMEKAKVVVEEEEATDGGTAEALEASLAVPPDCDNQLWQLQLCCVLQEVARVPTWRRQSTLQRLDQLGPIFHIFTFLVPAHVEVYHIAWIILERVHEHAVARQELLKDVVRAKALHLLEGARHDSEFLGKEDMEMANASKRLEEVCRLSQRSEEQSLEALGQWRHAVKTAEHVQRLVEDAFGIRYAEEECEKFWAKYPAFLKMEEGLKTICDSKSALKRAAELAKQAGQAALQTKIVAARRRQSEEVSTQAIEVARMIKTAATAAEEAHQLKEELEEQAEQTLPEASSLFERLCKSASSRAHRCEEAGRAFTSLRLPLLAANAFAVGAGITTRPKELLRLLQSNLEAEPNALQRSPQVWKDLLALDGPANRVKALLAQQRQDALKAAESFIWAARLQEGLDAWEVFADNDAMADVVVSLRRANVLPRALAALAQPTNKKAAAVTLTAVAWWLPWL